MIAAETSASGHFHVFSAGPARGAVWLKLQQPGQTAWSKWIRFADVPRGRTITGITTRKSAANILHLLVRLDDSSVLGCWQRANETTWRSNGKTRLGPWAGRPI